MAKGLLVGKYILLSFWLATEQVTHQAQFILDNLAGG